MKSDMSFHDPNYAFERNFWGSCVNTFGEEMKQWVYAEKMGLVRNNNTIDVNGKNIIDVGGGPVSLLLKCVNLGPKSFVVDPIMYPPWVYQRYDAHGVRYLFLDGESMHRLRSDEVWIYNVLQHCIDPRRVILNALTAAPVVRIFEWINFEPHPGHPHMLTEDSLSCWFGKGSVEFLDRDGCHGTSYSTVFYRNN
jgi:hypothetical protein